MSYVCMAQLNLCVYTKDGNVTKFVAAGVDTISFTCPDTSIVVPEDANDEYEFVETGLSDRIVRYNVGDVENKSYYNSDKPIRPVLP